MKLCTDCKHSTKSSFTGTWLCMIDTGERDPVNGSKVYTTTSCAVNRQYGPCGPEGKLFEPIGFTWWERLWKRLLRWVGI